MAASAAPSFPCSTRPPSHSQPSELASSRHSARHPTFCFRFTTHRNSLQAASPTGVSITAQSACYLILSPSPGSRHLPTSSHDALFLPHAPCLSPVHITSGNFRLHNSIPASLQRGTASAPRPSSSAMMSSTICPSMRPLAYLRAHPRTNCRVRYNGDSALPTSYSFFPCLLCSGNGNGNPKRNASPCRRSPPRIRSWFRLRIPRHNFRSAHGHNN